MGAPSDSDVDAIREIQDYIKTELSYVRTRATKWISGVTAISGVVTTAALIKGPETLSQISDRNFWWCIDARLLTVALLLLGGSGLAVGVYASYVAANGSPVDLDAIGRLAHDTTARKPGVAECWNDAISKTTAQARRWLRTSIQATFAGMALIVAAIVYAGLAPAAPHVDTGKCFLIQIKGALSSDISGAASTAPCAQALRYRGSLRAAVAL